MPVPEKGAGVLVSMRGAVTGWLLFFLMITLKSAVNFAGAVLYIYMNKVTIHIRIFII